MVLDTLSWLEHYIEWAGAILSLAYLFFSIKQNILLWPLGIISSALYVVVYLNTKLFALCGLQVYYVFISIYGWWFWKRGKTKGSKDKGDIPITHGSPSQTVVLTLITLSLFVLFAFILKRFMNSDMPYADSFITSLSIVATWMLARKIIDQWLVWIVADGISIVLYVYKGMYPTVALFIAYTVMAVIGYISWKKELQKQLLSA
ncbi:MAG: nicotinamide riboside transporter PnuC [Bacteroidota bacterium]|nr:nicotinamide riboside transporter PnuC [Bacteroidota bacterium]MDP4226675.1 nicotinamide riboside transporter PnuC [Bacteroidota bacterium]MDP4274053.1 nicotinamide riboside transporter PnuC [Bacteroidota bacterium]